MSANPKPRTSQRDVLFFWQEKTTGKGQKLRCGEIRAKSREHARYQLNQQGVRLVTLKKSRSHAIGRVKLESVASFVRQLAVMIQAGVPLGQSLTLISSGMTSRSKRNLQAVVKTIRTDVESGLKLSDAMRKHPGCFDTLFCNTLAAGEYSGELDTTLIRLATHLEKSLRIRQKVRKAMVYPSIVIVVAIGVTVGMLLFVLPSFKSVYSQFDADLPGITQFLLNTSDALQSHGLQLVAALVLSAYTLMQCYKKNSRFQNVSDALLLRLPLIGELMKTALHARWTRTFSTLCASGVPITSALESVASVAKIQSFQAATLEIRHAVATGARVSDSMEVSKLFPQETIQMVRIGEESGRLDAMLDRLANQFEINLDDKVDTMSTVMEPAIMCVIGGLVGVLIIGMYMPIFNIGGII